MTRTWRSFSGGIASRPKMAGDAPPDPPCTGPSAAATARPVHRREYEPGRGVIMCAAGGLRALPGVYAVMRTLRELEGAPLPLEIFFDAEDARKPGFDGTVRGWTDVLNATAGGRARARVIRPRFGSNCERLVESQIRRYGCKVHARALRPAPRARTRLTTARRGRCTRSSSRPSPRFSSSTPMWRSSDRPHRSSAQTGTRDRSAR